VICGVGWPGKTQKSNLRAGDQRLGKANNEFASIPPQFSLPYGGAGPNGVLALSNRCLINRKR